MASMAEIPPLDTNTTGLVFPPLLPLRTGKIERQEARAKEEVGEKDLKERGRRKALKRRWSRATIATYGPWKEHEEQEEKVDK